MINRSRRGQKGVEEFRNPELSGGYNTKFEVGLCCVFLTFLKGRVKWKMTSSNFFFLLFDDDVEDLTDLLSIFQ